MANTKSAKKQIRSSHRKWMKNRFIKGKMRSAVKAVEQSLGEGNAEQASLLMPRAAKELDKAARKNVIHANRAARVKARLMRRINELSS